MTNIQQATSENIEDITALFDEYKVFYKPKYDINSAAAFISERITKSDSPDFWNLFSSLHAEEENKQVPKFLT